MPEIRETAPDTTLTTALIAVLDTLENLAPEMATPGLELVAAQHGDPYSVLAGTLLSLRTRDQTTLAAFERLRALAPDPQALAAAEEAAIAGAIYPVAFYRVKAGQLKALALALLERHGGRVPDSMEGLLALPGVGRKTANLTLSLGFGLPAVCVDVHVHRIWNRLGLLETNKPDDTESALREKLPQTHWSRVNPLLVSFGQALCTPVSPWCSRCPFNGQCPRKGVQKIR